MQLMWLQSHSKKIVSKHIKVYESIEYSCIHCNYRRHKKAILVDIYIMSVHCVGKWNVHLNILSTFIEAFGETFISNHIKYLWHQPMSENNCHLDFKKQKKWS